MCLPYEEGKKYLSPKYENKPRNQERGRERKKREREKENPKLNKKQGYLPRREKPQKLLLPTGAVQRGRQDLGSCCHTICDFCMF